MGLKRVSALIGFAICLLSGEVFPTGAFGQTLKQVAKFDLPGPGGKRFDYLTIDADDRYLISAHLAAGQTINAYPPTIKYSTSNSFKSCSVLCSVGFLPRLPSSANSTISHAAAKMASSPCSCQNSMSNDRSGNPPSTSRVFHGKCFGRLISTSRFEL
jgi:hypothetical protein